MTLKPSPEREDHLKPCLYLRAVTDKMTAFNSCFHRGCLWVRHRSCCCGGGSKGDLSPPEGRCMPYPSAAAGFRTWLSWKRELL